MKKVPVICKDIKYWRAFIRDSWESIDAYIGRFEIQIMDEVLFYVPYDDISKLQGLNLEKALIYNCVPNGFFMEVLATRFHNVEPNIQEIWN